MSSQRIRRNDFILFCFDMICKFAWFVCPYTRGLLHLIVLMSKRRWHDDVNKWKHFPRYWPFVRGIYRSPVNSQHKGQWRGALMFSLIHAWMNDWVNNRETGDLRHNRVHYDVTVVKQRWKTLNWETFYWHSLTIIPVWLSNYISSKMWSEITYAFQTSTKSYNG